MPTSNYTVEVPIIQLRMVQESSLQYNSNIYSADCVIDMIRPLYQDEFREVVRVIGLNTQHKPTVLFTVGIGGVASAPVEPGNVFKPLLCSNSSAFILIHSHPAGSLWPSNGDLKLTKVLGEGADILNLKFIDHLILTPDCRYYSFKENGDL